MSTQHEMRVRPPVEVRVGRFDSPDVQRDGSRSDARGDRAAAARRRLIEQHEGWTEGPDCDAIFSHPIHAWRIQRILHHLRPVKGRILHVGCYTGFVDERLLAEGGREITGVDRLPAALERAAARGVEPVLCDVDVQPLDLPADHYDAAVAGDVLNALLDPEALLEDIWRVLKPGAPLIVTLPNLASIFNRLLLMGGSPPFDIETGLYRGGNVRSFTFHTLRDLLRRCGFEVQRLESSVFYLPVSNLPLLRRVLRQHAEWKAPRWTCSRTLARLLPRLGHNVIAVARKPVG